MKRALLILTFCATVVVPGVALGQAGPGPRPGESPTGGAAAGGPRMPGGRLQMQKWRLDAKAAAYAALTPVHRDRIIAIIADVAAGKQDRIAVPKLIDDLLTPDEQKAVRDVAVAALTARRTAEGIAPPNPDEPNTPGSHPVRGPDVYGPRMRIPSAGRFLLMVSTPPAQT